MDAPDALLGTGDHPPGSGGAEGGDRRAQQGADRRLVRRVSIWVALAAAGTNLVGAAAVFAFAAWVLPATSTVDEGPVVLRNAALVAVWAPIAVALGTIWCLRLLEPGRRWLVDGQPPTEGDAVAVLRSPLTVFRVQVTLWLASAAVFSVINGLTAPHLIPRVAFTVVLGGLSTSAVAYLVTERLTRPLAARALAVASPARARLPGVTARQLLAWALGTGIPVLGLVVTGIFALAEGEATPTALAVTMVSLGGTALAVGLWVSLLGARAVADPIRSVRIGLQRVEDGDLEGEIAVYDGSEIGLLQDGFNRMVEGLRERERVRDLFGRHVGEDVARRAEARGLTLGGEVRPVAVLFVDIVGSTRLAAEQPPRAVVDLLNCFFAVVVDTVGAHGGWVNQFQGDAALAVFGAPSTHPDPAGAALAAARDLRDRLAVALPDLGVGIGVAAGPAVAGDVGTETRFEYTVLGDPVNEAARLTELAKEAPGRVLASGATVAAARDADERARWASGEPVTLRGRTTPTVLHAPSD